VVERVKPYREQLGAKADASAKGYAKWWWQYGRKGLDLYKTIRPMRRVLVRAQVSRTHAPVFYPTDIVFSVMTIVFAFDSEEVFAVIQSNLHECWVGEYSSSLRTDQRYAPTDCFETFPFPLVCSTRKLDSIGEAYHEFRRSTMLARTEGLTVIYNHFHDRDEASEDIQRLRDLHVEMDGGVATAYGWDDLKLGHDFHRTRQGLRFTISESARREVLARLLKLNHERYAEEVAQGLHDKKRGKGRRGQGQHNKGRAEPPGLFDP
jgi:hypothetical protein